MKFEFSIVIPAPRETVWRVAQDTSVRANWDVRVREYIIHGTPGAGTPITIVFRVPFGNATGTGAFTLFDAPRDPYSARLVALSRQRHAPTLLHPALLNSG